MTPIDYTPPEINYLAKDYASFRRLMLDHLSQLAPGWQEQNPSDLGHAIVEVLAYAADYLSYYQDAIATEAYLGTARLRRSVRRHVRLFEYYLQEGCNARCWVQIRVNGRSREAESAGAKKRSAIEGVFLPVHTQPVTRLPGFESAVVGADEEVYRRALEDRAPVFETMHRIYLMPDQNEIPIRSAGASCLPRGSISALLDYKWEMITRSSLFKPGYVLILKQQFDPQTGAATPDRCHAVRLTEVIKKGSGQGSCVEVKWATTDALPFDLCIASAGTSIPGSAPGVALGNIVLADHGRTIYRENLPFVQPDERYRPHLRYPDLTFAVPYDSHRAMKQPASAAMEYRAYEAYGCVKLEQYAAHFVQRKRGSRSQMLLASVETSNRDLNLMQMHYHWTLRRDLLNSGPFDHDFQVEMEEGRRAYLRFGFGGMGKLPDPGERFVATYRIGNGSSGNVGAETIAHVVAGPTKQVDLEQRIVAVCNPIPGRGGADPETVELARLHAPYTYREQKACVTPQDYVRRVERHPAVLHAMAGDRWIGSRYTVIVYVQLKGGRLFDEAFRQELLAFIEPFRLIGHEVMVEAPCYVPVRIALGVRLAPLAPAAVVHCRLSQAFSDQTISDGQAGFFYPDRFTFGQSIHQSQVIARAMAVPGVARIEVEEFRRAAGLTLTELEIPVGQGEIIQPGFIDFRIQER